MPDTTTTGSEQKVLRFVTEETVPVTLPSETRLSSGFTLEGWVSLASMARVARVYAAEGFAGIPVDLEEGRYEALDRFRFFDKLCGIELPADFEVVLFAEASCKGKALCVWQDTPALAADMRGAKSAIVYDRRHRQQESIVLFSAAGWSGSGLALRLGERATVDMKVASLLAPPGVVVRTIGGAEHVFRGDAATLPDRLSGLLWTALRANPDPGDTVTLFGTSEPGDVGLTLGRVAIRDLTRHADLVAAGLHQRIGAMVIPDGLVVHLFSEPDFGGVRQIVADDASHLSLDWSGSVKSLLVAAAPVEPDGVVCLGASTGPGGEAVASPDPKGNAIIRPAGYACATEALGGSVVVPVGFRVELLDAARRLVAVLGPGLTTVPTGQGGSQARIVRFAGLATAANGLGLGLTLVPDDLHGRGQVPSFGDERLRNERWHHLALCWTGSELVEVLDGKQLRSCAVTPALVEASLAVPWYLGTELRAHVARLRLMAGPREATDIRKRRFESTPGDCALAIAWPDAPGTEAPEARWADATLPPAPGDSALLANMKARGNQDHQAEMSAAAAKADLLRAQARARSATEVANARRKARADVALHSIAELSFVRDGRIIYATKLESSLEGLALPLDGDPYVADTALAGDSAEGEIFFAAGPPTRRIGAYSPATRTTRWITGVLDSRPCAVAVHPTAGTANGASCAVVYWIDDNATLWQVVDDGAGVCSPRLKGLDRGPEGSWDLTVDRRADHGQPIWCNGREIYRLRSATEAEILVNRSRSPRAAAVVAHEGTLVWVDVEHEVVYRLELDAPPAERRPLKLYAAPDVVRGVAIAIVRDTVGDGSSGVTEEVPVLYWVAAERRQIEVAVIDTPGLFLWLDARPGASGPEHQHVPVLSDVKLVGGAQWRFRREGHASLLDSPGKRVSAPLAIGRKLNIECEIQLNEPPAETSFGIFRAGPAGDGEVAIWATAHIQGPSLYLNGMKHISFHPPSAVSFSMTLDLTGTDPRASGGKLLTITKAHGMPTQKFESVSGPYPDLSFNLNVLNHSWSRRGYRGRGVDGTLTTLRVWYDDARDRPALYMRGPSWSCDRALRTWLHFTSPGDGVDLGPFMLDLSNGFSVTADLCWDGPDENPAAILVLSSTDREDQIALVIEPDGRPALYLRQEGHTVIAAERSWGNGSAVVLPEYVCTVTWSVSAAGLLTVRVDGVTSHTERLLWDGEPRLYTTNTVGSPTPARADIERAGALLDVEDPPRALSPYRGSLGRLLAWNTLVADDELHRMGFDEITDPTPVSADWKRSKVTDQTRHRFLLSGRLDGSERPLSLFATELDGGLALVSRLSAAHTALDRAHADLEAAQASASQQKAQAIDDARKREAAARQKLVDENAKAERDLVAANASANQQRADANANRTTQEGKATEHISAERAKGEAEKAKARTDGDAVVNQASNAKTADIASAAAQLGDEKAKRDAKKADLASKR